MQDYSRLGGVGKRAAFYTPAKAQAAAPQCSKPTDVHLLRLPLRNPLRSTTPCRKGMSLFAASFRRYAVAKGLWLSCIRGLRVAQGLHHELQVL